MFFLGLRVAISPFSFIFLSTLWDLLRFTASFHRFAFSFFLICVFSLPFLNHYFSQSSLFSLFPWVMAKTALWSGVLMGQQELAQDAIKENN